MAGPFFDPNEVDPAVLLTAQPQSVAPTAPAPPPQSVLPPPPPDTRSLWTGLPRGFAGDTAAKIAGALSDPAQARALMSSMPGMGNALAGVEDSVAPAKDLTGKGLPGVMDLLTAPKAAIGAGGGKTSTSTHLGRPEDVAMLEEMRSSAQQYASTQRALATMQGDINEQHSKLIKGWIDDAREMKARYGGVADEMIGDYKSAALELRQAKADLKTMGVDPNRLWNTMPTTQKVMQGIGSLFGGFAEGVSGGKITDDVTRWFTQAVDKDIDLQREAIKRKMSEVELTQKERDSLWEKWLKAEDQLRSGATRATQLELSRVALATDDVKAKGELAKSIYGLGSELRAAGHGEFVAAQPSVTKTTSSGGGSAASTAAPTGEAAQKILALDRAMKNFDTAKNIMAEQGGKAPSSWSPQTAAKYDTAIQAGILARGESQGLKGRALKSFMDLHRPEYPKATGAVEVLWKNPATQGIKLKNVVQEIADEYRVALSPYQGGATAKKKGKK